MSRTTADVPASLLLPSVPEELPESARRVYTLLATEGPLTHKELVELSGMPPRTVRFAVSRLKNGAYVGERCNLMDTRQIFFYLKQRASESEATRAGTISKF